MVWVWNLNKQKVCHGHRAHIKDADTGAYDSQLGGAMCITKSGQVLSIDRNAFVKYCLRSNTYKIFDDNFILKRGTVSVLKASPYDENIVALGTKNGLITIVNLKGNIFAFILIKQKHLNKMAFFFLFSESSVLHKLRSHDSEIVSLNWTSWKPSVSIQSNVVSGVTERLSKMKVSNPKETKKTLKQEKENGREAPKPIVDAGDMFDIHSFDYLEDEFGTITESKKCRERLDKSTVEDATDDRTTGTNNENFDFAEACQSLRDQIRSNQSDTDGSEMNCDASAINISDIKNLKLNDANDSYVCSSAHDSDREENVSDAENVNEHHAEVESNQWKTKSSESKTPETETIYLASGAQEPFIVIWNIDNGSIYDKIQLKSQPGKSPIPSKYSGHWGLSPRSNQKFQQKLNDIFYFFFIFNFLETNCFVVWIKSDEFIVNGPDGKLSLWKLDYKT